jgi:hypothetical protein
MELTLDGWLKIASVVVTLLVAYFGRQRRPQVEAFLVQAASHPLPPPAGAQPQPAQAPARVNTHTLIVRNSGREAAKNVRIAHTVMPGSVDVWPVRNYENRPLLAGGGELVFDVLSPGEQVRIAYLYSPPLTYVDVGTTIKSDEGVVGMLPITTYTRVYPKWAQALEAFFALVGIATLIFLALKYLVLPYLAQ